jgi:hypothetical protein
VSHPSPFRNNRYEQEEDRRHVYYLLPDDLSQLEQLKSSYIVGTRGTGKTTLLKSLSWRERLESRSLQHALKGDARLDRYLGVYLKLPKFQLEQLQAWLADARSAIHAPITALYLDLIWLEALLDAVEELRSRQLLSYSLEAEGEFIAWFDSWWTLRGGSPLLDPSRSSMLTLKESVFRARNEIELASRVEVEPTEFASEMPVDQIGALGRDAAARLRDLCEVRDEEETGRPQWHIRVCMDEAEVLADEQQVVVNTMVRLSEFPLYFVIAYVAMPREVSRTLLPNQSLSEADRHLEERDEMADTKFKRLTEGVSKSRVRAMLDDEGADFDLTQILGPLELDRWALEVLGKSESREVEALIQRAKALAQERGPEVPPPILEVYLSDVEGRTPRVQTTRKESSEGIRKKRPAAYIALLRKFGFDVRYASEPMVLQLSDGCIRDYLLQMDELFVLRDQALPEFIASIGIHWSEQDVAFKRASRKKRKNIVRRVEATPEEVERVVDGLALVTERLQRDIVPPEPGCFVLQLKEGGEALEIELEILKEANRTGYLRILEEDNERIEWRVHTSLAPAYGFSYRGAYYPVPLTVADLANLRTAPNDSAAATVVGNIVQRFSPPASGTLFEPPSADD